MFDECCSLEVLLDVVLEVHTRSTTILPSVVVDNGKNELIIMERFGPNRVYYISKVE